MHTLSFLYCESRVIGFLPRRPRTLAIPIVGNRPLYVFSRLRIVPLRQSAHTLKSALVVLSHFSVIIRSRVIPVPDSVSNSLQSIRYQNNQFPHRPGVIGRLPLLPRKISGPRPVKISLSPPKKPRCPRPLCPSFGQTNWSFRLGMLPDSKTNKLVDDSNQGHAN
jgi:hypothetical protein